MDIVLNEDNSKYIEIWKKVSGHVLQHPAWGEVKSPVWTPYRFVVFKDEEAVAVLQVLVRTTSGIKIGYAPRASLSVADMPEITKELKLFLQTNSICDFVLFEFNHEEDNYFAKHLPVSEYSVQPRCTNVVDVSNIEAAWMAMKGKYRRNIKKSQREDVTVQVFDTQPDAVDAFYSVMQEIFKATDYVMHHKSYFVKVWELLSQYDLGRILVAYKDGEVVGAYLVALDETTAYELYGGVTLKGRDLEAGYLLKWEAMQETNRLGRKLYDHWGVAPRNREDNYVQSHPLASISTFKLGFGGNDHCFARTRVLVLNGFKYKLFTALSVMQKMRISLQKKLRFRR